LTNNESLSGYSKAVHFAGFSISPQKPICLKVHYSSSTTVTINAARNRPFCRLLSRLLAYLIR
ncbi:hypothetical protein, partial [Enterobacter hormaechei]|uniref:hypothetical protein n=1 Tax=Enterobacter hormaechei TaxID=158836 RepID=UPI001D14996E